MPTESQDAMPTSPDLPGLVPDRLKPLTPLEEKLLEAAPLGSPASLFEPEEAIDPAGLGEAQSVRSEFLAWLLTDPDAQRFIHYKGIHLRGAKLVGVLDLEDANVAHPLFLRECKIEEKMILERGEFKHLDFSGSLTGPILAESIHIASSFYLTKGFKAKGEVYLGGAQIGADLDCKGGEFDHPEGFALVGDGLTTQGAVFLSEGFKANGMVRLHGAVIGVTLECDGGEFNNPDGVALSGDGLTTQGSVFLRDGFKANGEVVLSAADIGGYLICDGGKFENPKGFAFRAEAVKVAQFMFWVNMKEKISGKIDLVNANVGALHDDIDSWPAPGDLHIDGLTYGPFSSYTPADWRSRLHWLRLRDPNDLSVQPYEQLIHVFRQMGLRDDARQIAIAKQQAIQARLTGLSKLWSWVLGATIDYGYRPEKVVLRFILPIIVLGILVFSWAHSAGLVAPAGSPDAALSTPYFEPVGYSLDVFLPIVDLHQESAWEPNLAMPGGRLIQYYLYLHILAGWFFTTLAVAGVTGLVRSD